MVLAAEDQTKAGELVDGVAHCDQRKVVVGDFEIAEVAAAHTAGEAGWAGEVG